MSLPGVMTPANLGVMTPTELLAKTSTPALVLSALTLDAIKQPTEEQRLVRSWTCDELERRHPEVTAVMEAWAEDLDTPASYVETLVAALP